MSKSVSTRDARNQFGALMKHVHAGNEEVIITSYNKPKAVLVSFAAFENMKLKLTHTRRLDALDERKTRLDRARARRISPRVAGLANAGSAFADDPDAA